MIYLDNATTSFPKAPGVAEAMATFVREIGVTPARAGHASALASGRTVLEARLAVAAIVGLADPLRIVFTASATEGINLLLKGLARPGTRIVTSTMEHNAVARPLAALADDGADVARVRASPRGEIAPEDLDEALAQRTDLMVIQHASNVTGAIQPIEEIARRAAEAGALLVVDAAQSAGALPISMARFPRAAFVFSGHKGLLGPQGVGVIAFGAEFPAASVRPLVCGGTGSRSDSLLMPEFLPDRFEAGTPNAPGIAGTGVAARFVSKTGIEMIRAHEKKISTLLWNGLASIERVTLLGPSEPKARTGVVSFIVKTMDNATVAMRLEEEFGVFCRAGLLCAPWAHQVLGTFPEGCVRLSPGWFTTEAEIAQAVEGVRRIVHG